MLKAFTIIFCLLFTLSGISSSNSDYGYMQYPEWKEMEQPQIDSFLEIQEEVIKEIQSKKNFLAVSKKEAKFFTNMGKSLVRFYKYSDFNSHFTDNFKKALNQKVLSIKKENDVFVAMLPILNMLPESDIRSLLRSIVSEEMKETLRLYTYRYSIYPETDQYKVEKAASYLHTESLNNANNALRVSAYLNSRENKKASLSFAITYFLNKIFNSKNFREFYYTYTKRLSNYFDLPLNPINTELLQYNISKKDKKKYKNSIHSGMMFDPNLKNIFLEMILPIINEIDAELVDRVLSDLNRKEEIRNISTKTLFFRSLKEFILSFNQKNFAKREINYFLFLAQNKPEILTDACYLKTTRGDAKKEEILAGEGINLFYIGGYSRFEPAATISELFGYVFPKKNLERVTQSFPGEEVTCDLSSTVPFLRMILSGDYLKNKVEYGSPMVSNSNQGISPAYVLFAEHNKIFNISPVVLLKLLEEVLDDSPIQFSIYNSSTSSYITAPDKAFSELRFQLFGSAREIKKIEKTLIERIQKITEYRVFRFSSLKEVKLK